MVFLIKKYFSLIFFKPAIIMAMSAKKGAVLVFLALFVFSRFLFLADYPHFYDSSEYLRESVGGSFSQSLAFSHEVIHPVWLVLTRVFQKINPTITAWEISLISAVFGLISFVTFYLLVKRLFSEKVALLSLIPLIFFPHLWLIQTNILHESLDSGLFLISLLFFTVFISSGRSIHFIGTVLFLSLTLLDFVGMIIWCPVFVGLAVYLNKNKITENILWAIYVITVASALAILGVYLLPLLSDPLSRLKLMVLELGSGVLFKNWNPIDLLRIFRNSLMILVYGYGLTALLGAFLAGYYLFKQKNRRALILIFSFVIPFLLTAKFWYGGLYGRYSVLIAYPLALLLALIPVKKMYRILVAGLFITFLPTFGAYQKPPIPEIQKTLINQIGLNAEDLLILSDYQRPQLPFLNAIYLNGDDNARALVIVSIEKGLAEGRRIFISRQAIDFPYRQYDGQKIHIISRGDKNKAVLKSYLDTKKLVLLAENSNYPLLGIYQITR